MAALSVAVVSTSCSSGPQAAQPGTPEFYWAAAKATYRAGEFVNASENLQRIIATDNPYAARARAWDTVISAGLARAYIEYADTWELGMRANRANSTPFRNQASTLRRLASASAIQFTENVHRLMEADKEPRIRMSFAFPSGAASVPVGLKRVGSGILVPESERDLLQAAMLHRGVLLSACAFAGSPDDAASGQEKLKAGEYLASRDVFLLSAARTLSEVSDLFVSTKMDQPSRLKLMSEEALRVLGAVPECPETKALVTKIQARLKKANIK
jgi:hypothetical protein